MSINSTKIYIKDYNLNLLKQKLYNLDKYFRNKETVIEVFSSEGFFNIDNNKLYKLTTIDKPKNICKFENYNLLFDNSYFEKENVSQIPIDHIILNTTKFYYEYQEYVKNTNKENVKSSSNKSNNNINESFLILVIEGIYENKIQNDIKDNKNYNKDKYCDFIPINFYFLINESFDNILIKNDLNGFLSMLN